MRNLSGVMQSSRYAFKKQEYDEKKTIFIAAITNPFPRYLLRNELYETLKSQDLNIVLLTPFTNQKRMEEEFGGENIFFEKLEMQKQYDYYYRSRLASRFLILRSVILNFSSGPVASILRRERLMSQQKSKNLLKTIDQYLILLIARRARYSRALRRFLVRIESAVLPGNFHTSIFKKYRPSLLILGSIGVFPADALLIREAAAHHVKTISVVTSWDHTSAKGISGASQPERVIAMNNIIRKELIDYHDVKDEKIFVGGVPQFDHYFKPLKETKEEFCRRLSLSTSKKTILFATASPSLYCQNSLVLKAIVDAVLQNKIIHDIQIIVRLHPIYLANMSNLPIKKKRDFKSDFKEMEALQDRYSTLVHLDIPQTTGDELFDIKAEDAFHLASMLKYSDIMINFFSTLMIEAAIFDLPIINYAFGVFAMSHYINTDLSASVWKDASHIQNVLRTKGARIAYNEEELIAMINMYLENRSIDAEGRKTIVEEQCGPNRGTAGRAIGEYILSQL